MRDRGELDGWVFETMRMEVGVAGNGVELLLAKLVVESLLIRDGERFFPDATEEGEGH